MPSELVVRIEHEADIVHARLKGRELAAAIGFSSTDQALLATAISEIARNIVTYAGSGSVTLRIVDAGARRGVTVIAKDEGPGIPDVELALRDGYSTGKSLGLGLPGARRIMDDFELESTVGVGTTVTMTKWLR